MRVSSSMLQWSAGPLGLALFACGGDGATARLLGPDRDGGLEAERFSPSSIYQVWWQEVQECIGFQGEFARLRFFKVVAPVSGRGAAFPCDDAGTLCPAFWQEPHDIYLAPAFLRTEPILKHEMIHDLRQSTDHDHFGFELCTGGSGRVTARQDVRQVVGGLPADGERTEAWAGPGVKGR